jgi:serine phosphatase RsbU (regulator of sigma subunit)
VRAGEDAGELLVRNIVRATGEERWLINKATPVFDDRGVLSLVVNVIEDVTDVKRAELRQRVLAQAGAALSSSLEYEGTLHQVAQLAVPGLADWCGVNMPDRYGLLRQVAVAVSDPDKAVIADRYGERYPGRMSDPGGAAEVIRSGQAQMVTDIPDALLVEAAQDNDHLAMLRELGMRAVILVPLTSAGRTIGALSLVMAESGRTFDDDDMDLARELGRRAALAVENARLYSERSEIAATLQRSLLPPDLPEMPGWSAATLYRAAGEQNEVGGDFYDAFAVPGGWMVLVGDVAGRGAEAAALTSLARYTLRTAGQILGDPVAAFERLNVTLRERPDLSMVSVCCVVLRDEAPGARAEVVCAGHPPLYHLDRQGTPRPVGNHAPFLGAFDDSEWSSAEVELSGADQLVLYTDGVIDTIGETERFGERRLSSALAGAPEPGEVVRRIDDALTAFAAGEEQQDDTAVLVVRRDA